MCIVTGVFYSARFLIFLRSSWLFFRCCCCSCIVVLFFAFFKLFYFALTCNISDKRVTICDQRVIKTHLLEIINCIAHNNQFGELFIWKNVFFSVYFNILLVAFKFLGEILQEEKRRTRHIRWEFCERTTGYCTLFIIDSI